MISKTALCIILGLALMASNVQDYETAFHKGPVIPEFGNIASVNSEVVIPKNSQLKVRFDVSAKAQEGEINRTFDSAARFVNLHVDIGVPLENISIAIVVHGGASVDVTRQDFYKALHNGEVNANIFANETLVKNRTRFFLCGQSAAFNEIDNSDLLPSVIMALSAMTMHALLGQQGYSLVPF